jgi:hypothetical protein
MIHQINSADTPTLASDTKATRDSESRTVQSYLAR